MILDSVGLRPELNLPISPVNGSPAVSVGVIVTRTGVHSASGNWLFKLELPVFKRRINGSRHDTVLTKLYHARSTFRSMTSDSRLPKGRIRAAKKFTKVLASRKTLACAGN